MYKCILCAMALDSIIRSLAVGLAGSDGKMRVLPLTEGFALSRDRTALLDEAIRKFTDPVPLGFSIVAVGGHGRQEMVPGSDGDLIILAPEKSPAAEDYLYGLYYGFFDRIMPLVPCVPMINYLDDIRDFDVTKLSAFRDMRLLAGDEALFHRFKDKLTQQADRGRYVRDKIDEVELLKARHTMDRAFHLKLGQGGLKQFNAAVLLMGSRDWLSSQEVYTAIPKDVLYSAEFLLRYRGYLEASGRDAVIRPSDTGVAGLHQVRETIMRFYEDARAQSFSVLGNLAVKEFADTYPKAARHNGNNGGELHSLAGKHPEYGIG
jgi:hypothetical protein